MSSLASPLGLAPCSARRDKTPPVVGNAAAAAHVRLMANPAAERDTTCKGGAGGGRAGRQGRSRPRARPAVADCGWSVPACSSVPQLLYCLGVLPGSLFSACTRKGCQNPSPIHSSLFECIKLPSPFLVSWRSTGLTFPLVASTGDAHT